MDEVLERLMADAKSCLYIDWEDPATDRSLAGWIQSGINYLNDKAGQELDYPFGGDDWTLLMDYTRYARDASLDVFENNFRSKIVTLQKNKILARRSQADEESAVPPEQ